MTKQKVCVLGLGYIGLPTASILANKGYQVLGIDINQRVVDTINKGRIHIVEPDLNLMVHSAVMSGNLKASLKPEESDIYIIAVPTPFILQKDGKKIPDMTFVDSATISILPFVKEGDLVILESTSPVGSTEKIREMIKKQYPEFFVGGDKIHVAHCPERVLPGNIIKEFIGNDRIIGVIDQKSSDLLYKFYKSFVTGDVFLTTARTAEMSKLTENAFRDVNIAFANELSIVCDKLNIDCWELIQLANKHPRVNILQPGPGVGGHCLAVDPWFIVDSCPEARLIKTAREVNEFKPHWVVNLVENLAKGFAKKPTIGCLGLAYKPDIDDLRESPSIEIAKELMKNGFNVVACEPNIKDASYEDIPLSSLHQVVEVSQIILLLVKHKEFSELNGTQWIDKKFISVVR